MEEIRIWLWLTLLDGITSSTITKLLEKFHSAEEIFKATKDDFSCILGVAHKNIDELCNKSMKMGDEVIIKVLEVDDRGRTKMTIKGVTEEEKATLA